MRVLVLAVLAAAVVVHRKLVLVTVRGQSMEPTYREGDRVLVRRGARLVPGRVVVLASPPGTVDQGWLIKRIAATAGDPVPDRLSGPAGTRVPAGKLVLLGDNPEVSLDSREIGYFPADRVLGAVIGSTGSRRPGPGRQPKG
ncbi:S26 family signal peptidase [Amycolatopsis lurida]